MAVTVAVIDSGINASHPHVGGIAAGVSFSTGADGAVVQEKGCRDAIGHGTAIAGVIRLYAPEATLTALKIFHTDLTASMAALVAALEWAVSGGFRIIHLSLGTTLERCRKPLRSLCARAAAQNTLVVAAARSADDPIYPAVFDTVIGVYQYPACPPEGLIHHPGVPVNFGAHGRPRPIPGLPQERNFRGSSFAAAHVTGRVAAFLEAHPEAGFDAVMAALRELAAKGNVQ
ncbi:S8 family serine peptidase [Desulfococcus sp.]|uniref:subtilisin-like serine protease QhpE n=1 Tax=Desulfococcus sp. TaxID=2025834 RepID=UPI00359469C6